MIRQNLLGLYSTVSANEGVVSTLRLSTSLPILFIPGRALLLMTCPVGTVPHDLQTQADLASK